MDSSKKLSLAVRTSFSASAATGRRLIWISDRLKAMADVAEREEMKNNLRSLARDYLDSPDIDDTDDCDDDD